MLKSIFMARLRDQPAAWTYPAYVLDLLGRMPLTSIGRWIQRRCDEFPKMKLYDELWWEFQGAHFDLKNIPWNRRMQRLVCKDSFPISYAYGTVPFMGNEIKISPPLLIPRPDTESWISKILPSIEQTKYKRILDIGCGTGCISLGLANHLGQSYQITGIDSSRLAIRMSENNRRSLEIINSEFKLCDVSSYSGEHDIIISNPPYIPHSARSTAVSPCTKRWESATALHCPNRHPDDGAHYHRKILDMVSSQKIHGCKMIGMELDGTMKQYNIVSEYAKTMGFSVENISDGRKTYRAILVTV